jgi:hypothetical protein
MAYSYNYIFKYIIIGYVAGGIVISLPASLFLSPALSFALLPLNRLHDSAAHVS